ncbi:multicopper oxidase domain-containing protein [Nocardia africana]|uniref:multicopper oxidase domain-containing protein n=1 Tax=Nocardia africana TaxID=134964 RepID=UPI0035584C82
MTRRGFLALGTGIATAAALAACSNNSSSSPTLVQPDSEAVEAAENARRAADAQVHQVALRAAPTTIDLGGVQVQTWSYDGNLPGREIRLTRGQVLRADLTNALPAPTTIHWHGIALRNNMDGMVDLTQAPGGTQRGNIPLLNSPCPTPAPTSSTPTSACNSTAACTPR